MKNRSDYQIVTFLSLPGNLYFYRVLQIYFIINPAKRPYN